MTPSKIHEPTAEAERAPDTWVPVAALDDSDVVVNVNGQPRAVPGGTTVADLLRALDLDPRMVVVEHNGEILRHDASSAAHGLRAGDIVELVHFVGGG